MFHDQFDLGYNQATSLFQHYGQESKESDEQILSYLKEMNIFLEGLTP